MVKLKQIKLTNFLSHKNTTLDFEENQQLLIDGKSGSGKSAIVDAIVWCFYGIGRADNRSLIKRGAKSAKVAITITSGKTEYQVVRSITAAGKHNLEISEGGSPMLASGVKQKQALLQDEILHCSYLLFINSIVYPQENTESFVNQNAAKRKDLLMEIVNAASFDQYYYDIKKYLYDQKEELSNINGGIETVISNISYDEEKIKDKKQIESKLKVAEVAFSAADKVCEDLSKISMVNNGITINFNRLTNEINNLKAEHDSKSIERINKNVEISELMKQNTALPADFDKKYAETRSGLTEIEEQTTKLLSWNDKRNALLMEKPQEIVYNMMIDDLNSELINKMNDDIELCPEIKKVCPILVTKRDEAIVEMNKKLIELAKKDGEQTKKADIYVKKQIELGEAPVVNAIKKAELTKYLGELDAIKQKHESLKDVEQKLAVLQSQITAADEAMKEITSKIAKYKQEIDLESANLVRPDTIDTEIYDAQITLKMAKTEVDSLKGESAIISSTEERLERSRGELQQFEYNKKLLEEKMEDMLLLKEAFGNNGLKAIVTDYVVPKLEDRINDILHQVSDFTIRLDTQKMGISDGVTLEGLFINIYNEIGEEFDFANYSGGEKLKITVAISEALAELQKVGFRVLDELFIGLDEESTESFVEVMNTLQQRFSQMLCISHLTNIKDAFSEKLTVVKQNGVSKIL